ncbi:hypothetical protein OF83DRAFT_1223329 [Amylostereum chailletii]|nr:hypothetical protein OF83DRAFT_1223329 [Amylostereum chailletii]
MNNDSLPTNHLNTSGYSTESSGMQLADGVRLSQSYSPSPPLATSLTSNPDPYALARILDTRIHLNNLPTSDIIHNPIVTLWLARHPNTTPSMPQYDLQDDRAPVRAATITRLVKDNVSHPHWLAANGILNQGWAPDPFKGPSEVNGVWIVEGKVQQVGPSMLVGAAMETGYRCYAMVGECLGSDSQSAIYVGWVRNHAYARTSPLPLCQTRADPQTVMIVFIICNINWALPLSPKLPTSSSIAVDWYWAFNLRLGTLIAPPSLVAKNIARIVDAHLPAMLHHVVGHEGYSVFVFPEWGNLTPMLIEDPWAPLSDMVEYLAHARYAIYLFSYSAVEQSLYKLITEAREVSAYQISHEVQERAAAIEKWRREGLYLRQ